MKNSAGVKFNDNTDLIIEADPSGEVTSCFNRSNNTEYVGGGGDGDFSTAEVTIIGDEGASDFYLGGLPVITDNGLIMFVYIDTNEKIFLVPLYKNNLYTTIQGADVIETSGNIELDEELDEELDMHHIYGNCSITLRPWIK